MTEASIQALQGLRDLTMIKWYIIPLFSIVLYIYTIEIKKARTSGNWNAVLAGLTLFAMDCINETWNGWVLELSGRSAVWTAPGDTALRMMVGWNIEIIFMFLLSGIVFYHTIDEDAKKKILGIPNQWFWAIGYAAFCVFVEILLNMGGHLVWEYEYWNRSFQGVWLIFLFGYLHFFVAIIIVINMKSRRNQILTVGGLFSVAIVANVIAMGLLGWNY